MELFLWSSKSSSRAKISSVQEPIQPYLFIGFLEFAKVEVVLDIGANIGFYSLMSTLVGSVGQVLSYEPDHSAYTELNTNIRLNSCESKVQTFNTAVSDKDGGVEFGVFSEMSGVNGVVSTSIHDRELFDETADVESIKLDSMGHLVGKVLGIKIDVEGHELEVIEGALRLLKSSPSIIQIENFGNKKISCILSELGFFQIYVVGYDFYYSNIENFKDPLNVKRVVEYSNTYMAEVQSGRFETLNILKNSVKASCDLNESVSATVKLTPVLFKEPEFAFYLLVDGEKIEEKWYSLDHFVFFKSKPEGKKIEVQIFVREKRFPDKKVIVTEIVRQHRSGYRPRSAIGNALGNPSKYVSLVNSGCEIKQGYLHLNTSDFEKEMLSGKYSNIVLLSRLKIVDSAIRRIGEMTSKNVFVITTDNLGAFKNFSDWLFRNCTKKSSISPVKGRADFLEKLKSLENNLSGKTLVLLSDQILYDVGLDIFCLETLISSMSEGSEIFAERLVNQDYSQQRKELVFNYRLQLNLMEPKSEILPFNEKVTVNTTNESSSMKNVTERLNFFLGTD